MPGATEYGLGEAGLRPQPTTAAEPEARTASLGASLRSLIQEAGSLAYEHLLLAALEAQRAGRNLIRMIIAGIFTAVLVVTAWLALVAAVTYWWVDKGGASWGQAFVAMAVINLIVAALIGYWIRKMLNELMFDATLRSLRRSSGQPDEGSVPIP